MDEIRMSGADMIAAMQEWVNAHMKDKHIVTSVTWNNAMCQFVIAVDSQLSEEPTQ